MKNIKRAISFVSLLLVFPALIYAAVTDFLILQDIGSYKLFTGIAGRAFSGPPSKYSQTNTGGILDAAGHFSEGDVSYEASYSEPGGKWPFVKVEVTQHSGSDSDKWLLHEVEDGYRKNPEQDNFRGVIREINGNRIFTYRRGTHYSWISNNIVIDIRYTDLQKTKPEPMEIVNAYLQKHPSTIPAMVMDKAHDEKWIKDEMERRLWLCDKWFYQLQLGKVQQKQVFDESVKSMNVFLDYREKYYGISAKDEKNLLSNYLMQNNGTGIKAKLKEYKDWWTLNKGNPINL